MVPVCRAGIETQNYRMDMLTLRRGKGERGGETNWEIGIDTLGWCKSNCGFYTVELCCLILD